MTNSADPDQLTSEEASRSTFTLFAKAGHIWDQQDRVNVTKNENISSFSSHVYLYSVCNCEKK